MKTDEKHKARRPKDGTLDGIPIAGLWGFLAWLVGMVLFLGGITTSSVGMCFGGGVLLIMGIGLFLLAVCCDWPKIYAKKAAKATGENDGPEP